MNEEEQLEGFSFVKILVGLGQFSLMKPREREDFLLVLMKYTIHREAKLYEYKKDLSQAKHDLETMRNFHGVA